MNNRLGKQDEMGSAHRDIRREARYRLEVEIEISGVDDEGQVFHERTTTRNVSEWGCAFISERKLSVDSILALRVASEVRESPGQTAVAIFQVVRAEREQNKWLVGAWKFGGADIWGVDLEKLPEIEKASQESRKNEPERHK